MKRTLHGHFTAYNTIDYPPDGYPAMYNQTCLRLQSPLQGKNNKFTIAQIWSIYHKIFISPVRIMLI